jgi:hypothetical protein
MEIAACCNMQDVPDVMAHSYQYIHEMIENVNSEIIKVSLDELINARYWYNLVNASVPLFYPKCVSKDGTWG